MISLSKSIYSILLYISIFFFIYPEKYVFIPFSSLWVIQFVAIIFSLIYYSQHAVWSEVKRITIYGLLIFTVGILSAFVFNHNGDLGIAERGILMILYSFWGLWISFLLLKSKREISSYALIEVLIKITIVQALVSFIFFLVPSIAELYRNLTNYDVFIEGRLEVFSSFRLVGIGDVRYATAAVQYGLMMWGVLALRRANYGIIGQNNIVTILVIVLFSLAGVMSGRVFFVMLMLTFPYIFFLYGANIKLTVKESLWFVIPLLVIGAGVFMYVFSENEDLVKWAFELFINFRDNGSFESDSTNQLAEMYIFPDTFKTWMVGDGRSLSKYGGFYMGTDVGYFRSIYYWGIIGTVIYLVIQYKLCKLFVRNNDSRITNTYILFFFVTLIVYMLKDFYSIEKLVILFVMVQAMAKRIRKQNI